ncbi:unnamed protein product [Schistocephalus solidus]|uniref:Uncharacterized protein n=1 Tax=Schistocephalus solidus TaxID=70667 RepID=A0A183TPL5_SCHSO|nr:unnamed protein product [Schistocephalus solidus]
MQTLTHTVRLTLLLGLPESWRHPREGLKPINVRLQATTDALGSSDLNSGRHLNCTASELRRPLAAVVCRAPCKLFASVKACPSSPSSLTSDLGNRVFDLTTSRDRTIKRHLATVKQFAERISDDVVHPLPSGLLPAKSSRPTHRGFRHIACHTSIYQRYVLPLPALHIACEEIKMQKLRVELSPDMIV